MHGDLRADAQLSIDELKGRITELAGHLNATNYRFLMLIGEFERRKGWSDGATQSCAHWLNWQCGIDLGAAREKVRTALALEGLPKISAAMERGELSYSKVRALTRVVTAETEDYFLSLALHGTAHHVETLVRQFRRAKEAEELSREARQQAKRDLGYYYDEDGCLILKAKLPAEAGVLLLKALEVAMQADAAPLEPAELTPGIPADFPEARTDFRARRADALGVIAETFLKHGAGALTGGDRLQIVVHVDADTLQDNVAGRCELEHGPSISAETSRRLACDASLVPILENAEGEPLNVGRKTRTIPPALRRALNARDGGCRFPGCPNKRFVDAHHVQHWAEGGETKLSNLATLCRFHHRQVHEGKVVIQVLDDGAFRFVTPEGESFDSIPTGHTAPLADLNQLTEIHQQSIDEKTAATRWRGEQIDYGLAIEVLLAHARRGKDVSAETSVATAEGR